MSVGEAKARLLEFGHRPRGPKAAIKRDPLFAAAVAFFFGVVISRFRPRPLLPLSLLFSPPVIKRVAPLVMQLVASRMGPRIVPPAGERARHETDGRVRPGMGRGPTSLGGARPGKMTP